MKDFAKKYLEILEGPLAGINLTRILDFEDFYHKQILDSVLPYELSSVFKKSLQKSELVIDVGFGGGFPLVPLASLLKDQSFIGIESKNKKAEAVKIICEELGIENVRPMHGRIESFNIDIPTTIIFKAVGKIPDCLNLLKISSDSNVFFYKGPSLYEQEELKNLGVGVKKIEELKFELPDGSQRILIGYRLKSVPRGTKEKKSLVKISALKTKLFTHT